MTAEPLDEVDKRIIHLLQRDARNNTARAIAGQVGVSDSTVGNRIDRLEAEGIVEGYEPNIDYEAAGYPLQTLFVCTVPVAERAALADRAFDLTHVVGVQEILSGERNLHVEAVTTNIDEIERLTRSLDELGIRINKSEILTRQRSCPSNLFEVDSGAE